MRKLLKEKILKAPLINWRAKTFLGITLVFFIIASALLVGLLQLKIFVYNEWSGGKITPFPVSVFPAEHEIIPNDDVLGYIDEQLTDSTTKPIRTSLWHNAIRKLSHLSWYQNLASPSSRILVIWPGDRKEQAEDHFGDILRWNQEERAVFTKTVIEKTGFEEGSFYPGRYVVAVGTTPTQAANMVSEQFRKGIVDRYPKEIEEIVPLSEALIMASLLEREAYTFDDMREIAGVFWNRRFQDMALQLDASLQYVKANDPTVATWWPSVRPADKFIDSPFNTYQNTELPPHAIANPSAVTLLAILNPNVTNCLFYFHHSDGELYCSQSYDQHVQKLKGLYGQGQ